MKQQRIFPEAYVTRALVEFHGTNMTIYGKTSGWTDCGHAEENGSKFYWAIVLCAGNRVQLVEKNILLVHETDTCYNALQKQSFINLSDKDITMSEEEERYVEKYSKEE